MSLFDSARFLTSAAAVSQLPGAGLPEIAFAGRSNAGKSTTINVLTRQGRLAFASKTPGRTQLINFFTLSRKIPDSKEREQIAHLVDLPGYGYAKRGQKGQEQIKRIIESYILQREQMTCLFVLIDSRLAPQAIDLEFTEWLGENGIPFSIIFTKADKLKGGRLKMNINAYLRELGKQWEELPPHFVSSSEDRTGRIDILNYIENINKDLNVK